MNQLALRGNLSSSTNANLGSEYQGSVKSNTTTGEYDKNDWPKFQKIDICWRMPQDNQRVMIYEKLEYAVKCYERDRVCSERYTDAQEQVLREAHHEHIRSLFKTIKQTKKLYREKLPEYTQQIKWATKDVENLSLNDSQS